jgi:hypothetical protein
MHEENYRVHCKHFKTTPITGILWGRGAQYYWHQVGVDNINLSFDINFQNFHLIGDVPQKLRGVPLRHYLRP